jgi:hypothetical protein
VIHLLTGFAGLVAFVVVAVAAYYAVSLLVLRGFGLLFPLAGWRRRNKDR